MSSSHFLGFFKLLILLSRYSSLLVSSVSPLLSLSHYVSSENYAAATRPALSALLPLPSRYIVPPKIRAAAKSSTEHLGLSTLDVDTYEDQKSNEDVVSGSDQIPVSLRRVRQTVVSMVRQPQHAAQFRLQALWTVAFDPLKELLGDKSHFVTHGRMTSFDCLALGYLSCALLPEMPQPWLAEALKKKYPTLCTFVHNGVNDCFGGPVRIEDALRLPNAGDISKYYEKTNINLETISLPWKQPSPPTFSSSSALIFDNTIASLPFLDPFQQNKVLASEVDETQNLNAESSASIISPALVAVGAAVAAMASYVLYSSLSVSSLSNTSSHPSAKLRLDDMGEAGAMLATLNVQADEVRSMSTDDELDGKVPVVEVGVEVENGLAVDKPL